MGWIKKIFGVGGSKDLDEYTREMIKQEEEKAKQTKKDTK